MGWNDYLDDPDDWESAAEAMRASGDQLRKEKKELPDDGK